MLLFAFVLLVESAASTDGGRGCHGFKNVAVHQLDARGRDPQEAVVDFCAKHSLKDCDALFVQVRALAHAGLKRVVSAAGESRYEYEEAEPWDGVVSVEIDRRVGGIGPEKRDDESQDEREARKKLCDALGVKAKWSRENDEILRRTLNNLRRCEKLFVDLGAHDGDTVRAFYRGQSDGGFGRWIDQHVQDRHEYCALAIEPSLDFQPPTDVDVEWLGGYAASDVDSDTHFFLGDETQVGNSLRMEAPDVYLSGLRSRPVKTIRLSTFLPLDSVKYLVVKMDIEGAEYLVLRDLLSSGVLCNSSALVIHILVEEHTYMRQFFDPDAPHDALRSYAHALRACGIRVIFDAELGRKGLTD